MDSDLNIKEIVKGLLTEYATYKISYGEVETETIFDDDKGHYELLHHGWIGHRRIHGCLLHVDILGDKIWIQHDGTEEGLANELVEAGIPRDCIVLAFHHPDTRKYTDFAIA
jgi:XisI protein